MQRARNVLAAAWVGGLVGWAGAMASVVPVSFLQESARLAWAQAPAGSPAPSKAALPGPAASTSASASASASAQASTQASSTAPLTKAPLPNVDDVVAKVQAFYDKTQSFQSEFAQEFLVKAYNQKKSSKGTVTFQKPGKMDWTYTDPKDNRVVSDGVTLRVYEASNRQMFEQPMQGSQYPAALSFLTGQGKLADAFKLVLNEGESFGFKAGYVLVGEPKEPTPAYKSVLFYVDSATSQVRRVLIIDAQGNRNRFDFLAPKVNVPTESGRFKFTPPAGTTVVRPQEIHR